MISAWGRGVDSSTAGGGFSSIVAVLGCSPSRKRSVDFLHNTSLVVNQARLPRYKYYSGMVFTYKMDRTTVTVGAPSMMAISTSPASAGASSSAWAATGSLAPAVALGSDLLSSAGTCGSGVLVACCAICGGWIAAPFSRLAHRVPVVFLPLVHGVGRWNFLRQLRTQLSACNTSRQVLDYST
jgi:hypothetical protein